MPTAYSYIRFSSAIQQKGDSLRRQTALREEYLAEHPELELDETLNMTDLGISAYDKSNITKGTLGVFLTAVKEGRIKQGSYLLVESLDRLSRAQVMDALEVFLSVVNAGITIVSLADRMEYSRENVNNNFANLIVSIVVMSRATEESATKSKRIRSNWDSKRANIYKKKLTAQCPHWLKTNEDKTAFELIPERVEVVKRIYEMSKDGLGNGEIVKRLNEAGVKTFTNRSNGWHISYIQKILSNKAVYGQFQMHLQRDGEITAFEQPIPNYFPAIMSKEEWLLVTSIRQDRRTRGGVSKGKHLSNMFSGLLRCGYCGGSMVMGGHVNKRADGTKRVAKYVACSNGRRGLGCKFVQWHYGELEQQLLEFCRSVDFATVINKSGIKADEIEDAKRRVIRIELDLQEKEIGIDNLLNKLEEHSEDLPKAIISRIALMEKNIANLKDEKEVAEVHVTRLITDAASQVYQQNAIIEIVDQLKKLDGTDLHNLRIRLSERIKRAIQMVYLFPIGSWNSDVKRKLIEDKLIEMGESKEDIEIHFAAIDKNASKENRFLVVFFNNDEALTVYKDSVNLFNKNLIGNYSIDEYKIRNANNWL